MTEDLSATETHRTAFARLRDGVLRHRWFLRILLLGLLLRLYHVGFPPDGYTRWPQTQSLMIARNFLRESMNLFAPAVDWRMTVAPVERIVVGGTTLQLVPWLTAVLYRPFGIHEWVGRVVPIGFSLIGLIYFYALVRRFYGAQCAMVGAFLLTVSPMYVYFGRAFAPESFALALAFAALYYYDCWAATGWKKGLVPALLACIFMLLVKPQMAFIAAPMAVITLRHSERKFWREPRWGLFALMTVLIPALYAAYSYGLLAARNGVSLARPELLNYALLAQSQFYTQILTQTFFSGVGATVSVLALLGLLRSWKGGLGSFAPAWILSGVLFYLAMPGTGSESGYYHLAIAPPACILAARLLDWALDLRRLQNVAWLVLAVAVVQSIVIARGFVDYPEVNSSRQCGDWIRENTPEDALILSSLPSPASFYYADRKGWGAWGLHQGERVVLDRGLIQEAIELGAHAVAIPEGSLLDSEGLPGTERYENIRDFLYDTYAVHRGDNFAVFLLNEPADLSVPQTGKLTFGTLETQKYLRGNWGGNLRTELGEPFVALGLGKEASILLAGRPGQQRFVLTISPAVENQTVFLSVDGEAGEIALPTRWEQVEIGIDPAPGLELNTITFRAAKQNEKGVSLLLFSLDISQVSSGSKGPPIAPKGLVNGP